MPTSKVKDISFTKTYEWPAGSGTTNYQHSIVFEDGHSGNVSFRSQMPDEAKIGAELTYESKPNGTYPPNIKIIKQNAYNGGGGKQGFVKQDPYETEGAKLTSFALGYATNIQVALIANGKEPMKKEIYHRLASDNLEWLKQNHTKI